LARSQPEGQPVFDRSKIIDGKRIFYDEVAGKTEEFDAGSYGNTLAERMSEKFFGAPFRLTDCPMELFSFREDDLVVEN